MSKKIRSSPRGRLEVDRFDLDQGEVALAFLRRADLTRDRVAGMQIELADLRGRHVDVVGTREVVVVGRAQEAEAVGQDLEDALREDGPPWRRCARRISKISSCLRMPVAPGISCSRAILVSAVTPISLSVVRSSVTCSGAAVAVAVPASSAGLA